MLQAVQQVFSRHGALAAAKYTVCRSLQRFMILDITHFMLQDVRAMPKVPHRDDVDCRFLSADEVREFAQDPRCDLPAETADRIAGGHDFCFAGIVDGQLACYCWLALHSIEAANNRSTDNPLSGIAISFPDQFAFRYKGYTHPDFRGQRLYQLMATRAGEAMRHRGIDYVLSSAEVVNFSALKSSYRSGFQYCGRLAVVVIGGKRFVRHPDMSHLGIRFDVNAEVVDRQLSTIDRTHDLCRESVNRQSQAGVLA